MIDISDDLKEKLKRISLSGSYLQMGLIGGFREKFLLN